MSFTRERPVHGRCFHHRLRPRRLKRLQRGAWDAAASTAHERTRSAQRPRGRRTRAGLQPEDAPRAGGRPAPQPPSPRPRPAALPGPRPLLAAPRPEPAPAFHSLQAAGRGNCSPRTIEKRKEGVSGRKRGAGRPEAEGGDRKRGTETGSEAWKPEAQLESLRWRLAPRAGCGLVTWASGAEATGLPGRPHCHHRTPPWETRKLRPRGQRLSVFRSLFPQRLNARHL